MVFVTCRCAQGKGSHAVLSFTHHQCSNHYVTTLDTWLWYKQEEMGPVDHSEHSRKDTKWI